MSTAKELAILISGKDTTATSALRDVGKEAQNAESRVGRLGSVAGGAGKALVAGMAVGATAILGIGAAALRIGGDFDSAYDAIRVGTGATGDVLKNLQADFKAVVKDVPTDFGTASQVIADLNTRTGATGDTLQALSKTILEMSRITKTDATANVAEATRVFGDWGVATGDQTKTLDMLFRASQSTGISLGALQGKVVQFGAPLRAMGFSLVESASLLGKWEKEGVNSELVLGSLRIAMGKFAEENVPMREGLESIIFQIQRMGPGAKATSLAMEVFGARAGPDMAAAILEGRFELGELLKQVEEGGETILGAAADTADFGEKWQKTLNRATVAIEPFALGVFGMANDLMDVAAPAFESFASGIQGPLESVSAMAKKAFGGDIKGAIGDLMKALSDAAPLILAQLQKWGEQFVAWIGPMIPKLLAAWWEGEKKLLGILADVVPKLVVQLGKWGRELWAWIEPQIPPMLTELGVLVGRFLDWITEEGPPLAEKFLATWAPAAIAWVAQATIDILPKLYDLGMAIGNWMITVGVPKLLVFAWKMGEAIVSGIIGGLGDLAGLLGRAIEDAIRLININAGPFHLSAEGFRIDAPSMPSISMPSIPNPFAGGGNMSVEEAWRASGSPDYNALRAAGVPGYASGGIVSGPLGAPELAIVHGGETVIPAGRGGSMIDYNRLAQAMGRRPIVLQVDGRTLATVLTVEQDYSRSIG